MRKFALLALGYVAFVSICSAEPRWCTVTGFTDRENPIYPPIAKAAKVEGTVLAHIIYGTTGKVENVEIVFGPPMLLRAVNNALMKWKVKTDAIGDAPCQTLVIVDFKIDEPKNAVIITPPAPPPGVLRVTVTAIQAIVTEQAADASQLGLLRSRLRRISVQLRRKQT